MKRICIIMALTLLTGALLWAEGQRRDGGNTFLEPLQQRDSVLIADQLRYGVVLENVQEGTPLALPEFQMPEDNPLRVVSGWQLDSTRVSGRKEKPARYDIKASLILTAYMGGQYELPTLPVLLDGDTLVFHPTQILTVTELPVDMETFQPHDIKPQVRIPYTASELFPWIYCTAMILIALSILILWLFTRRRKQEEAALSEPAHIRALRKLDKLRGDKYWKPEQQKAFYSGVTDALREYIVARYGVGAMEMTTAEIFADLKGSDIPEDLYAEMKELFERADFVKFAKYTATEEENAQVLPQAIRFVTTTYQTQVEAENQEQKEE